MCESDSPAGSATSRRPRTMAAVHLLCYGLLGLVLGYVIVARWVWPLVLDERVGVEPGRLSEVEQRIDPNTASWAELAGLPEIGEELAKGIVAYREAQKSARGDRGAVAAVFSCVEDLDAVKGIGPKRLARITPYVRFPATGAARGQSAR